MKCCLNETGIKPQLMSQIIELAVRYDIEKVILFGSIARGDFKRTSDIDIAVIGGNVPRFTLDPDEETETLLEYDVVDMESSIQPELLAAIEKEGKIIYEKI